MARLRTSVRVRGVAAAPAKNFGDWVDVAAPGTAVHAPYVGGGYAYWSGTSMAAPFVAGQAALLKEVAPDLDAEDLHDRILDPWRTSRRARPTARWGRAASTSWRAWTAEPAPAAAAITRARR